MIAFVLAQLADLYTGLNLPISAELNPVGALVLSTWPLAVLAKFGLIVLVCEAAKLNPRLRLTWLGTFVGIAGAVSNVRAMA